MSRARQASTTFANSSRVIHRQDYHAILLEEAARLGVEIKLNADVAKLDFEKTEVILSDGEVIQGDVIVGADGGLI